MEAKKKTQNNTGRSKSTEKSDKIKKKENVSKKEETVDERSKSRTKIEENALKKPLSAYMQWSLAERKKLKDEGVEGKDIMGELGQRWNKLSEKEKEKWEDLYEKDKERYETEINGLGAKSKTETKKAGAGKKSEKEASKLSEEKDKKKKGESNKKATSNDDTEDSYLSKAEKSNGKTVEILAEICKS